MPEALSVDDRESRALAALLPMLPREAILERYRRGKGDEIGSGKLASQESSAALAANAFGLFMVHPSDLPRLPNWAPASWTPRRVLVEAEMRFPWRGGMHPWLDVVVETDEYLIGIESKRYEPYRPHRGEPEKPPFSPTYWREEAWGSRMLQYQWLRDGVARRPTLFQRLNAAQLIKHALGLRTQACANGRRRALKPVLAYLYAEPKGWPPIAEGKPITAAERQAHAEEIRWFSRLVAGGEVEFIAFTYRELLERFAASPVDGVRKVGAQIGQSFDC